MVHRIASCFFLLLMGMGGQVFAAGIGTRASTLGLGFEYSHAVSPRLNARLNTNFDTSGIIVGEIIDLANDQIDTNEIPYDDQDSSLNTLAALLDWHPFGGGFRLTGGVMLNSSEIKLAGQPDKTTVYTIGDQGYTNQDLSITGTIKFRPIAPYVGMGWGISPRKGTGWAVSAELGVIYQGAPSLDLRASGSALRQGTNIVIPVTDDAIFRENLVEEENRIKDQISDFNLFPVLSLGVMYSF